MDSESIISLSIVFMPAPEKFHNRGFGWICGSCKPIQSRPIASGSRLMREGESERKVPEFSNTALARWIDADRTILECPRCGETEKIDR